MNRLANAAFLELSSGWTGTGLAVDEAVRGAAGRAALTGSGAISVATASRPTVTPGEIIEVSILTAAGAPSAPATPVVSLSFYNGGGSVIGDPLALPVQPAPLTQHGEGVLGARETFRRAWARVAVPAGAARAGLTISGAGAVAILRPFLAGVPSGRADPLPFDPGVHAEADLQLGVWPLVKPFQTPSLGEPQPGRIEFGAGPGRPAARRTAYDPARKFTGRLRCDAVQLAALETFWREGPSDFWLVDPATDRLCVASWAADGAPRIVEARGITSIVEVGLWLETA